MLQGLRSSVATLDWVEEIYVKEYHTVLSKLESVGMDASDFRIPDSEVKRRVTSTSLSGNTYSSAKYVPKQLLLAKLDAILMYFDITTSEKPKKMGFSPPDK